MGSLFPSAALGGRGSRGRATAEPTPMLKRLKRLVCRHSYMWSERRQAEICYHCGRARTDPNVGASSDERGADQA